MIDSEKYINSILSDLGFSSVEELINKFFLYELTQSYARIDKSTGLENAIRDRFIKDLYRPTSKTRNLMDKNILRIDWERWVFKNNEDKLGRTDISFYLPGIQFILECKRLESIDTRYINEGVARFINCDYSANDDYAGMIGFIVGGDITSIISGLKLKTASYDMTSAILGDIVNCWETSFKSNHLRVNNYDIQLNHLFFIFDKSI